MKKILIQFVVLVSVVSTFYSQDKISPEEIYKESYKSIVLISSYNKDGVLLKSGSGVIISQDGLIYTNFHVISGSEKIEVQRDSAVKVIALVAGFNADNDAAVIKIDEGSLFPMKVIDKSDFDIGETVYALGNPNGLTNTFSSGMISARREFGEMDEIQYTASTSHGSSGGALINSKGELIGITSSSIPDAQNLNFAIPVKYLKEICLIDYNDSSQVSLAQNIFWYYCRNYTYDKSENELFKYFNFIKQGKYSCRFIAEIFTKINLYDSSAAYLNKALEYDPQDKILYKLRGEAYLSLAKKELAIMNFNRAIEIDSNYYDAYVSRAFYEEIYNQNYKDAARDYSKAISLKPESYFLHMRRAKQLLKMQDTLKAYHDLEMSIGADDKSDVSYSERAQILYDMGMYYEACGDYTQAITYNNTNADYYYGRAISYMKNGFYKMAINDYLEILKMNLDDTAPFDNLGYCYMDDSDYVSAEKYFKKSIYSEPLNADPLIGISVLYYREGRFKDARKSMYNAMKIEPSLEKGVYGIEKMESKSFFWEKKERDDILKVFRLMGIDNTEHYKPKKLKKVFSKADNAQK